VLEDEDDTGAFALGITVSGNMSPWTVPVEPVELDPVLDEELLLYVFDTD